MLTENNTKNLGDSIPDLESTDIAVLTEAICNLSSVSGNEEKLANALEHQLCKILDIEVIRDGNALVARTQGGAKKRILLAGHIDTVPVANNIPCHYEERSGQKWIVGRGSVDMKGGVAVLAKLAATCRSANTEITFVFYDNEEVESNKNGLGRLVRLHPEWLNADIGILGEPTNGGIEGGCNGTIRLVVRTKGVSAHSARPWMGKNAIHAMAAVLERISAYEAQTVTVEGIPYRESLLAVTIQGGTATNVVPNECGVKVNYRFAPNKTVEEAVNQVKDVFAGIDCIYELEDAAPGARPGLNLPELQELEKIVYGHTGIKPAPKLGWTDVSRIAELGIPALNLGPGDPLLCHKDDEALNLDTLYSCERSLREWISKF